MKYKEYLYCKIEGICLEELYGKVKPILKQIPLNLARITISQVIETSIPNEKLNYIIYSDLFINFSKYMFNLQTRIYNLMHKYGDIEDVRVYYIITLIWLPVNSFQLKKKLPEVIKYLKKKYNFKLYLKF